MTIQQLRYAIAISETGSLNKAAETLFITQPSLTAALRELEKEIKIQIFNRSGRGVTLTNDGTEFILYARQVCAQYDILAEKYIGGGDVKRKFGVSTQHYSFAVKAFVEMVKFLGTADYEFAIRETQTRSVISDVHTLRSEIGILYLDSFNRQSITKLLSANDLQFTTLTECKPYVYLWKGHPLAEEKEISLSQLSEYPCLSFEQGENSSFYLSEEILSTSDYARTIKACDRATMLNLMVGLNGYTLCSGIICEELNGSDYLAVAFNDEKEAPDELMEIGYITRKNSILSDIAELYLVELKKYLGIITG